jgi:hypothetical protein
MSGGRYDYAYEKVGDDLARWVSTLRSMATRIRGWSVDNVRTIYDPKINKDRPMTIEDRARCLVHALMLERAATDLETAAQKVTALTETMHAVEWIASGDWGLDSLLEDS